MKRLEKISVLTAKLKKAVAEEGIGGLAGRTKGYLARAKKEKEFQREKSRVYRDILFISGCNEQLPHPHRYRVVHQMEQLEAGGYTCDTVYFQELKPWMVRCYGAFVIFRCPMTDTLREFATMAKQMNKPLWYDVDDLVIDTKFTDQNSTTAVKVQPIKTISAKRVGIRYGDQGGIDKEGVIELRRGAEGLDLGNS